MDELISLGGALAFGAIAALILLGGWVSARLGALWLKTHWAGSRRVRSRASDGDASAEAEDAW
jgi:hypothetical protein